jgi:hypothetical protein
MARSANSVITVSYNEGNALGLVPANEQHGCQRFSLVNFLQIVIDVRLVIGAVFVPTKLLRTK